MQGLITDTPDAFSGEYVQVMDSVSTKRITNVLPLIPFSAKAVVCDIGCGTGTLLNFIHSRVGEYHGVDFSKEILEYAEAQRAAVSFFTFQTAISSLSV
ncbi:methyltransferase domain-containing protein [Bdellovibrionota bacterium FG-2]